MTADENTGPLSTSAPTAKIDELVSTYCGLTSFFISQIAMDVVAGSSSAHYQLGHPFRDRD